MLKATHKIGVIGASGYTGADLVRLAVRHPAMEISALTANAHAGKTMAEVFPHLAAHLNEGGRYRVSEIILKRHARSHPQEQVHQDRQEDQPKMPSYHLKAARD